jgi:YD repeat-containing protein
MESRWSRRQRAAAVTRSENKPEPATSITYSQTSGATTYAYGGNTTTVTDAAGKWKKFTRDAVGNLVKVTEPDPVQTTVDTTYSYDALDHLTQVNMQRLVQAPSTCGGTPGPVNCTQTRTFTYDQTTQRLTSATNPETGIVTYTYKTDGMLDYKIDAKNQKVKYSYDTYGRVILVEHYNAGASQPDPCQTVTYTYDTLELDPNSGYVEVKNIGRLSKAHWGQVSGCPINYEFEERYGWTTGGLMTHKELAIATASAGSVYTGMLFANYLYDTEGRLTTVRPRNDQNVQYDYTYDTLGRPTKLT